MARSRLNTSRSPSAMSADDFKQLSGIGPAIEGQLHRAGIRTFAQLAILSPDEVASRIPTLSAARVEKQGWIHEAHKLVAKQKLGKPHKKEKAAIAGHQHYENFTIEFLLSENDEMRRTRMVHIQSGDIESWGGWQAERLVNFLARHTVERAQVRAKSKSPSITIPANSAAEVEFPSEVVQHATVAVHSPVVENAEPILDIAFKSPPMQPDLVTTKRARGARPQIGLAGVLHLFNLETVLAGTNNPRNVLRYGQMFDVRLGLDLTDVQIAGPRQVCYTMTIHAKNMNRGSYHQIGKAQGVVASANRITLVAGISTLPRALYRLEAAVILTPDTVSSLEGSTLKGWLEGGLLQVY